MDIDRLIEEARTARTNAFAPYSEYKVGAAVHTDGGCVYSGGNIEVSGRSTSIHAEMMAMFNATFDGQTTFTDMAISVSTESGVAPCGLCQHTIAQFTDELRIHSDSGDGYETYHLSKLIGDGYSPSTRHNDTVCCTEG